MQEQWEIHDSDLATAFLQMQPTKAHAEIWTTGVAELRAALGISEGGLMRVLRNIYGSTTAPRGLWLDLHKTLVSPGVHSPAPATVDHVSTPSIEIRLPRLFFDFFTFSCFRALNVVGTCVMHALCWQAPVPGQPRHFPVKSRHFPVNPCHFPVKPRHFPVKHCNELLQKKLQLAEIWNWRIQKSIFKHTTGI